MAGLAIVFAGWCPMGRSGQRGLAAAEGLVDVAAPTDSGAQ
jgi:hypothetical protein